MTRFHAFKLNRLNEFHTAREYKSWHIWVNAPYVKDLNELGQLGPICRRR